MKITRKQLSDIIKEELRVVLEKDDRCTRIAKSKYDVWPSAYASGAVVRCRKGEIWKDLKEEEEITDAEEEELKKIKKELEGASKMHKGQADRIGKTIDEGERNCGCGQNPCIAFGIQEKKKKAGTESSKESSLRDWFGRKGEKGSKGGWVDCNAPDGDGGYKACGREKGEKRSKYPACRPTPAACKEKGKGKSWGKKAKKEALNMNRQRLEEIIREELDAVRDTYGSEVSDRNKKSRERGSKALGLTEEVENAYYEFLAEGETLEEAEYQGRKVTLNKPMRGDVKKSKVYVKNAKGNVVKVNFGDPNMKIKKNIPARRKSFRARHNCDNPGPKWKARYWSCKAW
jgi:hypothetical protein